MLIWSVVLTTVLYLFVSVLSVSAYPPEYASWLDYIHDMGNLSGVKAVPAFYAANRYLGQTGVTVLMFALFGVILTSLIGNLLALSRLLFVAGRDGNAPRKLSSLNNHAILQKAIYVIVAISVFIPFLGRTAIGWIVDVTTLGATLIYCLISHAVYRHAKKIAEHKANIDALTGIKNRHAYLNIEESLDRRIAENHPMRFAIVIADVNNLKELNDSFGHKAGDECLRNACKVLCDIFTHSSIFRIGGDEFAVVAQDRDYENIDQLIDTVGKYNRKAISEGGVVIACGMSKFEEDACVASVFERADQNMYENKIFLKSEI